MRLLMVGSLALACCGGSPAANAPPVTAAATLTDTALAAPSHSLRRGDVACVVGAGFSSFLQTVALDPHPVFLGGRFHGFKIEALAPVWSGIEIRPGDVVTKVNGMPIERPEQALEVFRSLEIASELQIEYEHDGEPREMRYAIADGPAEATQCSTTMTGATGSSATANSPPAPRPPTKTIGASKK